MDQPASVDQTPSIGTSLTALRRDLLRRAVEEAMRARACRRRGDLVTARRLEEHAARMEAAARSIQIERTEPE